MATLTIRLDEETEQLLNHFSKTNQQTKSDIARAGLSKYLSQQKQLEDKKQQLEAKITVTNHAQVSKRIEESEASYPISDEEYEKNLDEFFAKELGLVR